MKQPAMALMFMACLASSFAFADNPSDAPTASNYESVAVTQQQNCAGHNRKHRDKKDESRSSTGKGSASKDDGQAERSNPEYPATANN